MFIVEHRLTQLRVARVNVYVYGWAMLVFAYTLRHTSLERLLALCHGETASITILKQNLELWRACPELDELDRSVVPPVANHVQYNPLSNHRARLVCFRVDYTPAAIVALSGIV